MANRSKRSALRLVGWFAIAAFLHGGIQSAAAGEVHKRLADANALVSTAPAESKPASLSPRKLAGSAKGPYYVDFRARTAASWGHAFVWYGKTSARKVEVAGLTPAGDTGAYMLG